MRKPNRTTNQSLNSLLSLLGFEKSNLTEKNQRAWRHPGTGTVIFLPSNKLDEPPLPANLRSVRKRLECDGHLDGAIFDEFIKTGNLPVAP